MRARCEPVKVRLNTKSLAEFARHWAKPRIARMVLVLPLATEQQIGRKLSRLKTRKRNVPRNIATFLTGKRFPANQLYVSEGTGLTKRCHHNKASSLQLAESYLAAHMRKCGTYVLVFSVSYSL